MGFVSLERALSKLGIASRSQTKAWILEGKLSVNGRVIKDPYFKVVPEKETFQFEGKALRKAIEQTIILNKPKGYVTTKSDEKGRKTIYDLLPEELQHLHPVGRLDMHTTGLLILTTDTQMSARLTDPLNKIQRVYLVTVEGKINDDHIALLTKGIEDGGEILKASDIQVRKLSNRESRLIVTLAQGKNREIRRMFMTIGHEVTALKRIQFGEYHLGELEMGRHVNV